MSALPDPNWITRMFVTEEEANAFIERGPHETVDGPVLGAELIAYQDATGAWIVTTKRNFESDSFWRDSPDEGDSVEDILKD